MERPVAVEIWQCQLCGHRSMFPSPYVLEPQCPECGRHRTTHRLATVPRPTFPGLSDKVRYVKRYPRA